MNNANIYKDKSIVLFDGSCGLCNRSIRFVLKKEKEASLYFSALQSDFGQTALKHFNIAGKTDSIVFIQNGKAFIKSGAALRICLRLKNLWPLMMGFIIVPPFIRNAVYDYIAKNRIKWFGTADYCEMMTPELKQRFLD